MTRTDPTYTDFNEMMKDERWLGFGYLGERAHALDGTDPGSPAQPELVARIDELILDATRDWTYDELFRWANSKDGRHFGDATFGASFITAEQRFTQAQRWGLLTKRNSR